VLKRFVVGVGYLIGFVLASLLGLLFFLLFASAFVLISEALGA